ncbi:MAG: transposase [Nitrospirae bacterium]|nr:transposase [Nitrospirota bacterium]
MPRISRAIAIGQPHHVTQRGNYGQTVFQSERDRLIYLEWLKTYSRKYSLKIWAYCLMGNHVHFVAVPIENDSLARTLNTLHMRYSQYVNEKRRARGHLWQGRFFSCILDEKHLYACVRYVLNNPVQAGIVQKAEDYRWSNARSHVRRVPDPILSGDCYLTEGIKDWSAYLRGREDRIIVDAIRKNTKSGRPCGDDSFVAKIEGLLGRRLTALPWGRPKVKR